MSFGARKPWLARGRESHVRNHLQSFSFMSAMSAGITYGYDGSSLEISRSTRSLRFTRDAARIAPLRARAAEAPRPARPIPPANTGLSNSTSSERIDLGGAGGVDAIIHHFVKYLPYQLYLEKYFPMPMPSRPKPHAWK